MRITYILLKGYKRFRLGNSNHIEVQFKSPVVVIVGSNGSGKSSFMRELCPLPSVRTDFETGGKKELHIEHENSNYKLVSDFTNRSAPHSFKKDGQELNVSGTTEVQTSLVEKYFGITNHIRRLVYSQVKVCQATKADRKNLFHNINPMDLSIILDTHKKASSKVRDLKATLTHLYARKGELDNKLLPAHVFQEHIKTKERLTETDQLLGKILYGLEQHIHNLKDRYRDDLSYKDACMGANRPLVPTEQIIRDCRTLYHNMGKFASIPVGKEEFQNNKFKLFSEKEKVRAEMQRLSTTIQNISAEIDEFQKHLENATDRPVSSLEQEIKDLDAEMHQYPPFPDKVIPKEYIPQSESTLSEINKLLFIFRDAEVKMIEPSELEEKLRLSSKQIEELEYLERELGRLKKSIDEASTEKQQHADQASIPSDCAFHTCGLRTVFSKRFNAVEERLKVDTEAFNTKMKLYEDKQKQSDELIAFLQPFVLNKMLDSYRKLEYLLSAAYFSIRDWKGELLHMVQTQPMMIVSQLEEYILLSRQKYVYLELEQQRAKLQAELGSLSKSTSLEFLQHKLAEKEKQSREALSQLASSEELSRTLEHEYSLHLEYSTALDQVEELRTKYDRGERALLVSKSLEYWNGLGKYYSGIKSQISEELRNIESVVREQENLQCAYKSEIVNIIDKFVKEKSIYEKIEIALSPTNGMPHKSMVNYLNMMINNVNYLLSQIWTYKLKIHPIQEDMPLDYNFRIEVANSISNDISQLSDGQLEVVNLAWVLAILLQLKILDKIPLFADELGRTFDPVHRMQILKFLGRLIDDHVIGQLFIANHFAMFTDGFNDCDVICLDKENMMELPKQVNEYVRFL